MFKKRKKKEVRTINNIEKKKEKEEKKKLSIFLWFKRKKAKENILKLDKISTDDKVSSYKEDLKTNVNDSKVEKKKIKFTNIFPTKNIKYSLKKEYQKKEVAKKSADIVTPKEKTSIIAPQEENKSAVELDTEKQKENNIISSEPIDSILEHDIISYLEELLDYKEYKLDKLSTEYNLLYDYIKELQETDEVVSYKEKLDKIRLEVEQIKEQLEALKSGKPSDKNYTFDENYIIYLINEYKNKMIDAKSLDDVLKIKNSNLFLELLEKIDKIDKEEEKIQIIVDNKIQEFETRDKDFNLLKKDFLVQNRLLDDISSLIKKSEYEMKVLEEKLKNSVQIIDSEKRIRNVEVITNNNLEHLLAGMIIINATPLIPTTIKSIAIANLFINATLNMLHPTTIVREKIVRQRKVFIENYEKEIIDNLKSIDDVFDLCDISLKQIKNLKDEFQSKFNEYNISEYSQLFKNLDKLESSIEKNKDYLKNAKKDFNDNLAKNKQNVKKLNYGTYHD